MKKVTNGDIGGIKFGIFAVTSFLNGPYQNLNENYYFGNISRVTEELMKFFIFLDTSSTFISFQ